MPQIIDAHQHFWQLGHPAFDYSWLDKPELKAIRKSYLPPDLKPQLQAAGVDRCVFVQTQHKLEENRWVLGLADQHDFIAGVVGWVDLYAPDVGDQLLTFTDHPKFVGIRHVVQDEPDENWIVHPHALRGLKVLEQHGVPYDLLFYTQHLRHAATLAKALPKLKMVINHLSKPKIKTHQIDEWKTDLQIAAQYPNMYCKLSGMITEADWAHWKPADLKPYVDAALEAFGPERCMFGSDWPVCELAGTYAQVIDALRQVLAAISETERAAIFGGTASRFYGLG